MTIEQRGLSVPEARCLHQELKTTPNILGYTVRELLRQRRLWAAEAEGAFAGACFNVDLLQNWTEIAAVYVLPPFQGRGIGRALFNHALADCRERGRHIFVLSRNPAVIRWMEEAGLEVGRASWRCPLAFHLYSFWYMAHPYRNWEMCRKLPQMLKGTPMMQGSQRHSFAGN